MSFSTGGTPKKICARAEVRIFARAGPKSRGAEHAVRAKLVNGIKLAKSRAGRPKKASLRGGVKCLRGGNKCASGPPYSLGLFQQQMPDMLLKIIPYYVGKTLFRLERIESAWMNVSWGSGQIGDLYSALNPWRAVDSALAGPAFSGLKTLEIATGGARWVCSELPKHMPLTVARGVLQIGQSYFWVCAKNIDETSHPHPYRVEYIPKLRQ
ncbi:hypothetical protein B0H11DRAFT_1933526 [Mycena galericulata]|nr:hypothetical protein B0H11DRAFT_1933526 [Mycena galericulata]